MGESSGDGVSINFVESDHEEMLSTQLDRLYNTEFRDSLVNMEQSWSGQKLFLACGDAQKENCRTTRLFLRHVSETLFLGKK